MAIALASNTLNRRKSHRVREEFFPDPEGLMRGDYRWNRWMGVLGEFVILETAKKIHRSEKA
jgi:hypothetical protein